MPTPVRIQLSRKKGFRLQEVSRAINGLEAVKVTRPGKWGNPYILHFHGDAARCVTQFRETAITSKLRRDAKRDLRGKNLACFCKLGDPCHADVLLELANKD